MERVLCWSGMRAAASLAGFVSDSKRLLRPSTRRKRALSHSLDDIPHTPRSKGSRMKAIVIHEFGPPDVLKYEDVPDPQPRDGRNPHPRSCRDRQPRARRQPARRQGDVSQAGAAADPRRRLRRHRRCGRAAASRAGRSAQRVAAAGVMPLDVCPEDCADYDGPEGMMGIKRPGGFAELVCVPACAVVDGAGRARLPRRRGGDAARADGLESPGQRRRAQAPAKPCWSWAPAAISAPPASRSPRT